MTYNAAHRLLAFLVESMPKGYPRPRLVLHESPEAMVEHVNGSRERHILENGYGAALVMALADHEKDAVHIHELTLAEDHGALALVFLHEISHLRDAKKHGENSAQHCDEKRADAFARRWWKKLAKNAVEVKK